MMHWVLVLPDAMHYDRFNCNHFSDPITYHEIHVSTLAFLQGIVISVVKNAHWFRAWFEQLRDTLGLFYQVFCRKLLPTFKPSGFQHLSFPLIGEYSSVSRDAGCVSDPERISQAVVHQWNGAMFQLIRGFSHLHSSKLTAFYNC